MSQTVYANAMPIAHAGARADTAMTKDVLSRLAEAAISSGLFVVPGTDAENQAKVPAAAAAITAGTGLGVVLYEAAKEPAAATEFADEETLPILQKGRVWVRCDAAASITANTQCYVRYAAGAGGSVLGTFREDDPGTEAAALPNAVFRSVHHDVVFQADTIRVALVELNLPTV